MSTAVITQWMEVGGHLFGNVTGHPTIDDGSFVRTTRIQQVSAKPLTQGVVVTTENTTYALGEPLGRV